jgi:hypothetical protein
MRFTTFDEAKVILINVDEFIVIEQIVLPDGTPGIQIANHMVRGHIDDLALQLGAETFNPSR